MSPKLYEQIYGEPSQSNLSFVKINSETDNEMFKEKLISDDSFLGVTYKTDSGKGFLNSVDSLNSICDPSDILCRLFSSNSPL